MKNLIILIFIINFLYCCKAQTVYNLDIGYENITTDSFYIKDIDNIHDSITGVWKWEDDSSLFEITLQEFEMYNFPGDSNKFYDLIYGKYTYIESGIVISSISTIETPPNIYLSLTYHSPDVFKVIIKDSLSLKSMHGEFVLISPNTATLNLWSSEGVKVNSPESNSIDFSLPMSLTLIRQN